LGGIQDNFAGFVGGVVIYNDHLPGRGNPQLAYAGERLAKFVGPIVCGYDYRKSHF
jgi:hypothetical protein